MLARKVSHLVLTSSDFVEKFFAALVPSIKHSMIVVENNLISKMTNTVYQPIDRASVL